MVTAINTTTWIADSVIYIRDDLLDNGPTDPISSGRTSGSAFVMTSYPRRPTEYPIITVKQASAVLIQRGGMQSSVTINHIRLQIKIWARNVKERDELTQGVLDRLRSIQQTATTGSEAVGLHDFVIESVLDGPPPVEGEQITQSKIIVIRYLVILGE